VLYGHHGQVASAVFDARGERVVSAGADDGTVRVWHAASGRQLVVVHRYKRAYGAGFSRDGKVVVSAGYDAGSESSVVRTSACSVCGRFGQVLQMARSRADRPLSEADRRQLTGR